MILGLLEDYVWLLGSDGCLLYSGCCKELNVKGRGHYNAFRESNNHSITSWQAPTTS